MRAQIVLVGVLVLGLYLIPSAWLNAQSTDSSNPLSAVSNSVTQPLSLMVNPTIPKPGDTVQITLKSRDNIDYAMVRWTLNGKEVAYGRGVNQYSFKAGNLGSNNTVTVTATFENGVPQILSQDIKTAVVNVLWQARTYTPPFYQGAARHSPGSIITFYADVEALNSNGRRIPEQELLYIWSNGNTVMSDVSGRGRSSFTIPNKAYLRDMDIKVKVSSLDGSFASTGGTRVVVDDPQVILYQAHPLRGEMNERGFNASIAIPSGHETRLVTEPYFFSVSNRYSDQLEFTQNLLSSGASPIKISGPEITIQPPENKSSYSLLDISVRHLEYLLQIIQGRVTISSQ